MNDINPSSFQDPLPVSARIIMLLLAMVLGLFIGQMAGLGIAEISGLGSEILTSPGWKPENSFQRTIYRAATLLGHLFTFLVPALLYARISFPQQWKPLMQTNQRPLGWQLFYGSLWIIVAFPVAQYLYVLNQMLPLPEWATSLEDGANELVQSLLVMETPFELLFTLLIMAAAPALGEEFIFRGLIQRLLELKTNKPHLAIFTAAVIFSAFHMQFEGFFPRLMLGLMLGYLFYWTRSIWVPVAVHFVYNGIQVVAAWYMPEMIQEPADTSEMNVETYQLIISLGLTFLMGYFLYRRSIQNEDPNSRTT
ncbi:MAG: CPBP family intramembrane metalloprotease [Bacteroidetes bacterium]|nr:CPBP family intramembrane metalloprotease [Bacteroidota bacterium]